MRITELRKKTNSELGELLRARTLRREELVMLLRQKKTKNVKELRGVKRDVARIHTRINELRIKPE